MTLTRKFDISNHLQQIFNIQSESDFIELSLDTFRFQYDNVSIYREYCQQLKVTEPQSIDEIPFLPIEFFKSHSIRSNKRDVDVIFKSSGTMHGVRSQHFVEDVELYQKSFVNSYRQLFGNPEKQVIIALLPNYVSQKNSSLVYMVDHLIELSKDEMSGFYLDEQDNINKIYVASLAKGKEPILFGVTYALLDLADRDIKMPNLKIIETGGMKGKRQELSKEEVHQLLKSKLGVTEVYSEYGMCELLSQAYSTGNNFKSPPWMRILIRDKNDPFSFVENGKQGGINVIDLANFYSCSFIQTQDLGRKIDDVFSVNGRIDHSEIRGCNLMLDELN